MRVLRKQKIVPKCLNTDGITNKNALDLTVECIFFKLLGGKIEKGRKTVGRFTGN